MSFRLSFDNLKEGFISGYYKYPLCSSDEKELDFNLSILHVKHCINWLLTHFFSCEVQSLGAILLTGQTKNKVPSHQLLRFIYVKTTSSKWHYKLDHRESSARLISRAIRRLWKFSYQNFLVCSQHKWSYGTMLCCITYPTILSFSLIFFY